MGGATSDLVGLLTPALLLCQERRHGARANPGFRSGRAVIALDVRLRGDPTSESEVVEGAETTAKVL
jgi:hypothetical protein